MIVIFLNSQNVNLILNATVLMLYEPKYYSFCVVTLYKFDNNEVVSSTN